MIKKKKKSPRCFGAYLSFAGSQHGNPASNTFEDEQRDLFYTTAPRGKPRKWGELVS